MLNSDLVLVEWYFQKVMTGINGWCQPSIRPVFKLRLLLMNHLVFQAHP